MASTVWKPALEKIALTFAVVAALGSIALTILMAQECLPDLASLKVPTMSKHVWIFLLRVNPVLGLLARSRLSRTLSFIYGTVVIDIMILGLIMPER